MCFFFDEKVFMKRKKIPECFFLLIMQFSFQNRYLLCIMLFEKKFHVFTSYIGSYSAEIKWFNCSNMQETVSQSSNK
jgi:hypothetical protein